MYSLESIPDWKLYTLAIGFLAYGIYKYKKDNEFAPIIFIVELIFFIWLFLKIVR